MISVTHKRAFAAKLFIQQWMKLLRENENKLYSQTLSKTYFIVKTGWLYSGFSDLIEPGKIRGVSFHCNTYNHKNAWRKFVLDIASYLFSKYVRQNVIRKNFVAILNDGTTDAAKIEQEVIYCLLVNLILFSLVLYFLLLPNCKKVKFFWIEIINWQYISAEKKWKLWITLFS